MSGYLPEGADTDPNNPANIEDQPEEVFLCGPFCHNEVENEGDVCPECQADSVACAPDEPESVSLSLQPGTAISIHEFDHSEDAFLMIHHSAFVARPSITIEELEQLSEECQRVAKSLRKRQDEKLNNKIASLDKPE